MPTLTLPVQSEGLLVDLVIGLGSNQAQGLLASGQPIPGPILVRGILDTGADCSAVSRGLVQSLSLVGSGSVQTHTPAGSLTVLLYEASLSIVPPGSAVPLFTVPQLLVTELRHAAPGIAVLVGLDVMLQGVLALDGPARKFSLTF